MLRSKSLVCELKQQAGLADSYAIVRYYERIMSNSQKILMNKDQLNATERLAYQYRQ